jgi:phosphatidate cytidylyltransferase
MKRVLTAIILIPLVLLVLFKAPMWLFTLVVGLVALGSALEYLKIVDAYGVESMKSLTLALIAFVFGYFIYDTFYPGPFSLSRLVIAILLLPFLLLISAMATESLAKALPRASMSALVVPYVLLPLFCLPLIRAFPPGVFLILFTCVVVWSGDIFAYYAGRTFGKHKLAPRISPGKTWEGTIASFLGSVVLALILFVYNQQIMLVLSQWHLADPSGLPDMSKEMLIFSGVILGACVNIAAQIGDLVESMLKRGAGVKDSGAILPGHGGILDRIDALLFALPVVFLYAVFSLPLNI